MTRKSDGRIKRDLAAAALADQNVRSPYLDLEDMYATQRRLFGPYYQMAKLISDPEVSKYLVDIVKTLNLVRGLSADVKDLHERTEALHTRHAGKTTMPDLINEDENMDILMMFENYSMLFNVHQQTIVPILTELDEHLRAALRNKETAESQTAAPVAEVEQVANHG
jgi:hypothetical protein